MTTAFVASYVLTKPSDSKAVLKSLPLPGDRTPPKGRLITFSGFRDVLDGLRDAHERARQDKLILHRADLVIDIGSVNPVKAGLKDLPKIKALNLGRMKADLAATLQELLFRSRDRADDPATLIGLEPQRLNDIWKDRRFAHLAIIAWQAPLDRKNSRQMAAIASKSVIEKVDVRGFAGEVKLQFS